MFKGRDREEEGNEEVVVEEVKAKQKGGRDAVPPNDELQFRLLQLKFFICDSVFPSSDNAFKDGLASC